MSFQGLVNSYCGSSEGWREQNLKKRLNAAGCTYLEVFFFKESLFVSLHVSTKRRENARQIAPCFTFIRLNRGENI